MSLGVYNRTAANRTGTVGVKGYDYKEAFVGALTALVGGGEELHIRIEMTASMEMSVAMRHGYDAALQATADMAAGFNGVGDVGVRCDLSSMLAASMRPEIREMMACSGSASLFARAVIYVRVSAEMSSELSATFSGMQTRDVQMRFDGLSIPPGGVLTIDSEFFTATLNGVNVIDRYTGDWLEITRKLKRIEATSSSSGDIGVSVLYRERYL